MQHSTRTYTRGSSSTGSSVRLQAPCWGCNRPLQRAHSRLHATKQRPAPRADRQPAPALGEVDPALLALAKAADAAFQVHTVQWYPGHIARAERQLKGQLKMVDVVFEVRDARIPHSTCHPQVPLWIGSKPRLIVLNRQDMISKADRAAWDQHFNAEAAAAAQAAAAAAAAKRSKLQAQQQQQQQLDGLAAAAAAGTDHLQGLQDSVTQQQQQQLPEPPALPQQVFWTDGKTGSGVHALRRAALKLSGHINERRARRGLAPRPVRAVVIGFPNIGKSALINRLLGRRVVESAARPGVTRVLRWVRLGEQLDLLDAPGIIPAAFNDQTAAQRLAMCNDIGEAAYVDSLVAAALLIRIKRLPRNRAALARLQQRYKRDPLACSAEDFVAGVAGEVFGGDKEQAGLRLLHDFRSGAFGELALELPGHM